MLSYGRYFGGFKTLTNLILIVEGKRFHSTFSSGKEAEKMMKSLERNYSNLHPFIEDFYVDIKRAHSTTRVVEEWDKEKGYSLWYSPADIDISDGIDIIMP
ncbi:MAG: hypothetical protein KJI71_01030 [Patescibacteria group bacterium]|nr:hypothetical protein [Patescibacteria group bacterium]